MRKRWLIIAGLASLFMVLLLGIAGCGALADVDGASLQNSIGAANGPGSGQWKPRAPRTAARCQEFHGVLARLADESGGLSGRIDELYPRCFDEEGFLLPEADQAGCVRPMNDFMNDLRVRYVDFETGARVYENACIQSFAEALPLPSETRLPLLPPRYNPDVTNDPGYSNSALKYTWCLTCIDGPPPAPEPDPEPKATKAPETEDPEGGNGGGSKCCRCLTCVNNIDVDYLIVEAPAWLPDSFDGNAN